MMRRALWLAVLLPGCVLRLEHITAVRDLQDRFSALAAEENAGAARAPEFNAGEPDFLKLNARDDELAKFHRGYAEVHAAAEALLGRAGGDLESDDLLGAVATLRVLAFWRATFYAHLLRAEEMPVEGEPAPMTRVRSLAQETAAALKSRKSAVYPRDLFLLEAMGALVRYDIAYVRAVIANRRGEVRQNVGRGKAKPLIAEMARAEEEMAAVAASGAHLEAYRTASRYRMLVTARTFASLCMPVTAAELPELKTRIDAFHADMKSAPADLRMSVEGLPVVP